MFFNYLNLNKEQRTIELPIDTATFKTVKSEVEGSELENIEYYWVFWVLRDYLFKVLILDSFEDRIIAFLKRVHLNGFEFKAEAIEIVAVNVCYYFYYGESIFLLAQPSSTFHEDGILVDRLELNLDYDTDELENLLEQLLDAFGVQYVNWKEENDISGDELELSELFGKLMFDSWKIAKIGTDSNVLGMYSHATGGSGCYDLDNGNEIEETDEGLRAYVAKRS